jgi:hypothetical protein
MPAPVGETVKPTWRRLAKIRANPVTMLPEAGDRLGSLRNIAGKSMPCGKRSIGSFKFGLTCRLPIGADRRATGRKSRSQSGHALTVPGFPPRLLVCSPGQENGHVHDMSCE